MRRRRWWLLGSRSGAHGERIKMKRSQSCFRAFAHPLRCWVRLLFLSLAAPKVMYLPLGLFCSLMKIGPVKGGGKTDGGRVHCAAILHVLFVQSDILLLAPATWRFGGKEIVRNAVKTTPAQWQSSAPSHGKRQLIQVFCNAICSRKPTQSSRCQSLDPVLSWWIMGETALCLQKRSQNIGEDRMDE